MISLSPTNDKTYSVSDPALTWPLAIAGLTIQVPACGYDQSFTMTVSPSFNSGTPMTLTTSSTNIDFNLYTTILANEGIKTITLVSTLQSYSV